jgi:hypothetical protein
MALARRENSANKELAGRGLVKLLASISQPCTGSRVQLSAVREEERLTLTRHAETQCYGGYGTLAIEFSLGEF